MNKIPLNIAGLDGGVIIKKGGGGGVTINNQEKSLDITENGSVSITPDVGYTGLGKVNVNVDVPTQEINNQQKSVDITENGVTEVTADAGFTGLSKVKVTTAIPTEEKTLEITENGTTEVVANDGFLSKVIVNTNVASSGGGEVVASKGINFYDCDGTMLHTYSASEAKTMSELPALPERQGLICQGWNCELDYIKHMADEYGRCDIGAIYITDDEMTRMYVVIDEFTTNTISISFTKSSGTGVLSIDWGDGSPVETITSYGSYTKTHTYEQYGNFCISIGGAEFTSFSVELRSKAAVTKVEMGRYPSSVNWSVFPLLKTVSLSQYITSVNFKDSGCLVASILPNGISKLSSSFENCFALQMVSIPQSIKTSETAFRFCTDLKSVVIPEGFDTSKGNNFRHCYNLEEIIIPKSLQAIGSYEFAECRNLRKVDLHADITSIGGYAFNKCYALEEIVIPDGVVSLSESNVFQEDKALRKIILPDTMTTLGYYCFGSLSSLMHITLPKSLTRLDRYCFAGGNALSYDFSKCESIPTMADWSSMGNLKTDCKIIVPDTLYDEWIAATNWSTLASQIIKKSDWDAQS